MYAPTLQRHRRAVGIVVVEFALVMTLLVPALLFGLWEMGRLIHVKQIVSNASREGARLASQAIVVQGNGTYRRIFTSKDPEDLDTPTIRKSVMASLLGAGLKLQQSDVTIQFKYLENDTTRVHPYQPWKSTDPNVHFPKKGEPFEVTVSIPYAKVRWVNLNPYASRDMSGDQVISQTVWRTLVNDQLEIDTSSLPVNP